MHHLIQNNLYNEFGFHKLVDAIKDLNLPYGIFKMVPFTHELEYVDGIITGGRIPTMVWGCTSVEAANEKYGWNPGVFKNENFDMRVLNEKWGPRMLNADAKFYKLGEVPGYEGTAFIRPVLDSKSFTGQLMNDDEFEKWREGLYELRDEYTSYPFVQYSSSDAIHTSGNNFLVNYKKSSFVDYVFWASDRYHCIQVNCNDTPLYQPMWEWAQANCFGERVPDTSMFNLAARGWTPAEAFVLDVARTAEGFNVIEVNCINSAGFYDCDMTAVVKAVEHLHEWPEQW